jgi:deoxyribodipyrimidine photo-lyase
VHPWALRAPPPDLRPGTLRIGVYPSDFHRDWPWSAKRWAFVDERMAALTEVRWVADAAALAQALRAARSVRAVADPHLPLALCAVATLDEPPRLFADPGRPYASFSPWWGRVTRGVHDLHDLPGIATLSAGPLFDA